MDASEAPLTILLLTYGGHPARRKYAETTLIETLDKLTYHGPLFVHIADDGSPPEHRDALTAIASNDRRIKEVTISNSEHCGYGANYNLAALTTHPRGGAVLCLEDDWQLTQPLDAGLFVSCLSDAVQCVRLGYLGWTQPLRGTLLGVNGVTFWLLDPESPEPHVFAGHPRIETVEFQQRVGEWPVINDAGATEFEVAHRPASRHGVVWPDGWRGYAHIGTVRAQDQEA